MGRAPRSVSITRDISSVAAGLSVTDKQVGNLAGDIQNFSLAGKVCKIEESEYREFSFVKSVALLINGKTRPWVPADGEGQIWNLLQISVNGQPRIRVKSGRLKNASFTANGPLIEGVIDVQVIYDLVAMKATYSVDAKTTLGKYDVSKLNVATTTVPIK